MPKHLFTKEDPKIKERTLYLYRQGLTMREVGKIVGKSRQWVCNTVREMTRGKGAKRH